MKKDKIDLSREKRNKTFEKPILFSEKMVKAILENKKFVTRRPVVPQPPDFIDYFQYWNNCNYFGAYMQPGEPCAYPATPAKYWPGLKLWVRETWRVSHLITGSGESAHFVFRAGGSSMIENITNEQSVYFAKKGKWQPSIFMPRAVSRITLDVVTVSIERLHELDDIDATMEGCENREEFIRIWDTLNKKRGFPWAANPWVYRIQFNKIK